MANGKKKCPGCNTELGLRTQVCPGCGFDFSAAKKEKTQKEPIAEILTPNEPDETESLKPIIVVPSRPTKISMADKVAMEMRGYVYTPPVEKTKREHAQEILDRGAQKASFMYRYAKSNNIWSHVDWPYVAEQLGLKKNSTEEQDVVNANTDQQNS